jgi:hypothetical protein
MSPITDRQSATTKPALFDFHSSNAMVMIIEHAKQIVTTCGVVLFRVIAGTLALYAACMVVLGTSKAFNFFSELIQGQNYREDELFLRANKGGPCEAQRTWTKDQHGRVSSLLDYKNAPPARVSNVIKSFFIFS